MSDRKPIENSSILYKYHNILPFFNILSENTKNQSETGITYIDICFFLVLDFYVPNCFGRELIRHKEFY